MNLKIMAKGEQAALMNLAEHLPITSEKEYNLFSAAVKFLLGPRILVTGDIMVAALLHTNVMVIFIEETINLLIVMKLLSIILPSSDINSDILDFDDIMQKAKNFKPLN